MTILLQSKPPGDNISIPLRCLDGVPIGSLCWSNGEPYFFGMPNDRRTDLDDVLDMRRPALVGVTPEYLDPILAMARVMEADGWRRTARALLLHDLDINWWDDVEKARRDDLRDGGFGYDVITTAGLGYYRTESARIVIATSMRNRKGSR